MNSDQNIVWLPKGAIATGDSIAIGKDSVGKGGMLGLPKGAIGTPKKDEK